MRSRRRCGGITDSTASFLTVKAATTSPERLGELPTWAAEEESMARTIRRSMAVALCCVMATLGVSPAFARPLQVHTAVAPQGVKAKSVKTACTVFAAALRSGSFARFLTYLESNSTKEVIRIMTKNAATIAKALDYAVTYEELSMAIVRDQISHALRRAGVAESAAKTAAYAIQQMLDAAIF